MHIVDKNGQIINSEANIGCYHGMRGIFIESRSGTKGTVEARNPDYYEGLNTIISRLIGKGYIKLDIWVASANMQSHDLSRCKIVQDSLDSYYINSLSDPDIIRKDICRQQAAIKRNKESKGGNPTKRLFIQVEADENVRHSIILGNAYHNISLDVDIEEDKRVSTLRAIKIRRGQKHFRDALLKAYGRKCAVTGCHITEILETAHISPYKGEHTNIVSNGLLLRSDIHTLFDLGLLRIDKNYKIVVSQKLKSSEYWQYNNCKLKILPESDSDRPSLEYLSSHLSFQKSEKYENSNFND